MINPKTITKIDDLKTIACQRRLDVLDMVFTSKAGHIGGSFSSMDVLVSLYYKLMDVSCIQSGDPCRDRFVLSKGHCAEALYAVLADTGFIAKEELLTFTRFGTRLAEHPTKSIPALRSPPVRSDTVSPRRSAWLWLCRWMVCLGMSTV